RLRGAGGARAFRQRAHGRRRQQRESSRPHPAGAAGRGDCAADPRRRTGGDADDRRKGGRGLRDAAHVPAQGRCGGYGRFRLRYIVLLRRTGKPRMSVPSQLPQAVTAVLSRAAVFLVVTLKPDDASAATARSFCGDLAGIVRAVGFRYPEEMLNCVMGVGSDAWDRWFGSPRPAQLHPFREIVAGARHAVSTPGDLLFHIRARQMDLCFELASQILARLGDAVASADEVHGFRYFDQRDLLGFVDGTENPAGGAAVAAALIGDEDPAFAG